MTDPREPRDSRWPLAVFGVCLVLASLLARADSTARSGGAAASTAGLSTAEVPGGAPAADTAAAPTGSAAGTGGVAATAATASGAGSTAAPGVVGNPAAGRPTAADPTRASAAGSTRKGATASKAGRGTTPTGTATAGKPATGAGGTVKVGFIATPDSTTAQYGAAYGFTAAKGGDLHAQIAGIVAAVNARGGLAGRQIVPVIRDHDINSDSQANEEKLCNAFADDDKVFAVVIQAQGYPETRTCYAKKGVLVIDPSPFSYDRSFYSSLGGALWSPNYPTLSRMLEALAPALKDQGYFSATSKLGTVSYDVPTYRTVVDKSLVPALTKVGQKITDAQFIANTDIPTISQGAANVVARFQAEGIDRVAFVGLGPFAPLFVAAAQGAGYFPRYAYTTFDSPRFSETYQAMNPQVTLRDAVGIGFAPSQDVDDAELPFPQANERDCLGIVNAAGQSFAARANARFTLSYCDAVMFLQTVGRGLSTLSVSSFAGAARSIGAVPAATGFGSSISDGRYDGAVGYRYLAWDNARNVFTYKGDVRQFGS